MVITYPLLISFYGWKYFLPEHHKFLTDPADFLLSWVLPAIAIIVFWRYRQATPQRIAISARIVDAATDKAPTTGQMVGHYFAYFLSTLPLRLGFLWIAFDRRKQA